MLNMTIIKEQLESENYKAIEQVIVTYQNTNKVNKEELLQQAKISYEAREHKEKLQEFKQSLCLSDELLNNYLLLYGLYHEKVAKECSYIGFYLNYLGEYNKAILYFNNTLYLLKKGTKNLLLQAETLINIGYAYTELTDNQKADAYYKRAYNLLEKLKPFPKTENISDIQVIYACVINNMANNYRHMLQYKKALNYLKKAIEILGEKHPQAAFCQLNRANIFIQLKEYDKAIVLLEDLRKYAANNPSLWVVCYANIGNVYMEKGEFEEAVFYYQKALEQQETITKKQLTNILNNIGTGYFDLERYEKALSFYQKSLKVYFPNWNNKQALCELYLGSLEHIPVIIPIVLLNVIKALYKMFEKTNRKQYLTFAAEHFEAMFLARKKVLNNYLDDISTLNSIQLLHEIFEPAIQIALELCRLNRNSINCQQCFEFAEQAKASLLTKQIKTELITQKFLPKSLQQKEYQLKTKLRELNRRINQEEDKYKFEQKRALLNGLQAEYFDCQQKYETLIQSFEQDYPEYYQLKYNSKVVTVTEVQKHLCKLGETALIEYFIGDKFMYIYFISKEKYLVEQVDKPKNFDALIKQFDNCMHKNMNRKTYIKTAYELYQLFLQPVLENPEVQNIAINALKIIPDGLLASIPFEALLYHTVSLKSAYAELPYLLDKYDISYHFSATLWLWEGQRKAQKKELPDSFIGFAPVYKDIVQQTDYDVKKGGFDTQTVVAAVRGITRTIQIGAKTYPALVESEKEVKNIENYFKVLNCNTQSILHEKATVKNFKEKARNYKYVHVSAHHVYNAYNPQLSGIIFSPQPRQQNTLPKEVAEIEELLMDEQESSTRQNEQALFYINDAYNLRLNADLVVLSCCDTGRGEIAKGEGIMAINRGFLYSGASNVLYTLFKVYDKEASELTQEFFSFVLNKKMPYATALRAAKKQLIKRGAMPKHWAGYVLIAC